ncbi:MAG: transglycosylase SLT domain-containing protein [Desulfohalobiaceae bacterium]|nr:transglycosylase SLT domain-containing protein [Desulfohalobiaceae bacterium]
MNRRQAIKTAVAASVLPLYTGGPQPVLADSIPGSPAFNFLAPREAVFWKTEKERQRYRYVLGRAVLDFVQDHFSGSQLPVWRKPLSQVDLEKRVVNILYWLVRGVDTHTRIYPVDPAWLMAQILEESFFYEFAVSWAFAVGVCQFTQPTAESYGMVCPKSSYPADQELKEPQMAGERERLRALYREKSRLRQKHRSLFAGSSDLLKECLQTLAAGKSMPEAKGHLLALQREQKLDADMDEARQNYREFLRINFKGRSIFNKKDLAFLNRFDQRVLYKVPVQAMVRMMAEHLRGRNGNILAATAGYNAGLSTTRYPYRVYEPYGIITPYRETVKYVSKIGINYQEIRMRM